MFSKEESFIVGDLLHLKIASENSIQFLNEINEIFPSSSQRKKSTISLENFFS